MEELLEQVGECGRFQLLMFPMVMASVFMTVWSMLFMVFGAVEPDWWCLSRDFSHNTSWAHLNGSPALLNSVGSAGNGSMQMDNSTYKRCVAKQDQDGSGCEEIVFSSSMSTIVSEFRLVCDLAWVPKLTISVQMAGALVGASVAGQVADNLGRKKTLVGVISLHSIFILVAAFSVSWQMFAVMRFGIGFTMGGILATKAAYPTEFMGVKWRAMIGSVPVWSIGAFTFSVLVWALPNWYHIHIATAICSAACVLPWLFLPESVRYLATRGQLTKVERVLRKIARWNDGKCPSLHAIQSLYAGIAKDNKKYHLLHLFSSWEMAKISALNGIMWFCCSLAYYGISFGINNFSGNFYYNFMVMTALEIPSTLLVHHCCRWFGRRYTITGSLAVSTLCVVAAIPITLLFPEGDTGMAVTGLCLAARMLVTMGWSTMVVFAAELLPTVVRNIGVGFCSTSARVGGILAPYILVSDIPYVFYVIVSVAMATATLAPLFLQETRDRPLVDALPVVAADETNETNETSAAKKMTEITPGLTGCDERELQAV